MARAARNRQVRAADHRVAGRLLAHAGLVGLAAADRWRRLHQTPDLRSLLGTDQPFPAATPASELMQREVITLRETDSLETAFDLFARHDVSFLPVIAANLPGRVLGNLRKSDLVAAYDQQILKDRILRKNSRFSPLGPRRQG